MTRIPINDLEIIEQAIYLPILLTILQRDLQLVERTPFKLGNPYINLIEETIATIQRDLSKVKYYMQQHKIKVQRLKSDDAFTMYCFFYKGYEELHNYFNPKLRHKTEELLEAYLKKK
ncbi:hypothetical protein [Lederbergia galactosidilytica]|uniref:YhjD n=1 Tax=Lederbergia galactosidilytica TaxID=217031 RepID=A0A0Q9YFU5_9BACI|nr:hypothetical protein [Lederbergia galactosidilytica]KRG16660.1 hypothetical protein ACA30_00575 [Virgibacillus soli]KRG16706.1 hypothetical protein ACA29_04385 [Lederbergia galactosidilytica]MBP1915704.1 hypothetical protein [Lederbergia galactosidilytica]OAK67755.1 hypothetical protein ABB05_18830 [Lederbergia galactosidilytica]